VGDDMRTKDIKIGNKRVLINCPTDWEKMDKLCDQVDNGDYSAIDELMDLVDYYDEAEPMMDYVKLGAKRGNDKARYILGLYMNDWNVKKLLLFRELAKKKVLLSEIVYEETKEAFCVGWGMIILLTGIGLSLLHILV
jgi:hypothetical protein